MLYLKLDCGIEKWGMNGGWERDSKQIITAFLATPKSVKPLFARLRC